MFCFKRYYFNIKIIFNIINITYWNIWKKIYKNNLTFFNFEYLLLKPLNLLQKLISTVTQKNKFILKLFGINIVLQKLYYFDIYKYN